MAEYAYKELKDIPHKKIYADKLYENDKNSQYFCECGCSMVLCGGLEKVFYFSAKSSHNKLNGYRCPLDRSDGVVTGDRHYDVKKMIHHIDKDPSNEQIERLHRLFNIPVDTIDEIDTPPNNIGPATIPDDGIIIFPPYSEESDDDDENDNEFGSPGIDTPGVTPPNNPNGGDDFEDEGFHVIEPTESKDRISKSIIQLYEEAESGNENNNIILYRDGIIKASDLVVNRYTLSSVRKNGMNGLKLIHSYRFNFNYKPKYLKCAKDEFLFRDDLINDSDKDNRNRPIYYLIKVQNKKWRELYLDLLKNTPKDKTLHVYALSDNWEFVDFGHELKVYRATVNSRTFKLALKPKKDYKG